MSNSRSSTYDEIANALSILTDEELAKRLTDATPIGAGIGGAISVLNVGRVPVFIKSVPLSDLERQVENLRSTANLFGLPLYCQYGVSSPGFGAWRELESHLITTSWVLSGQCINFPLLYHWRVLPRTAPKSMTPTDRRELERQVAAWGGSEALRARWEARLMASARIVMCLEYFPYNLRAWLLERMHTDDGVSRSILEKVERDLLEVISFMNAHGLWHFDAHFENILTDGSQLYFSDFGQALSDRFTLTPSEIEFLKGHQDFDRSLAVTVLANLVRDTLSGAVIGERYKAISLLMNDFFRKLRDESKATPYPFAEFSREWSHVRH